jgi:predicted S18 family serine protease
MAQLEVPLPEISVEAFSRAWTRFELVAAAKEYEWNAAKQLAVLPALLRVKLLDYYLDLGDNDKADLKVLKAALKKKAGIDRDPRRLPSFSMSGTRDPRRNQWILHLT